MQLGLASEPGHGPNATVAAAEAAAKARRTYLDLTFAGKTLRLYPASVTIADDIAARTQVGVAVSAYVDRHQFGLDSFALLWWTARRKNGEPDLPFSAVAEQMPDVAAFAAGEPNIDRHTDDDDAEATDPEASGEL